MSLFGITVLFGVVSLLAISHGQSIRMRSGNGSQQQSCSQQWCGTSIDDLTAILTIVRALEQKEAPKSGIQNAEEIIGQLVNALIFATTHRIGNGDSGNVNGDMGGMGGMNGMGYMAGMGGMGGIGCPSTPTTPKSDDLIDISLLDHDSDSGVIDLAKLAIDGKTVLNLNINSDS